MTAAMYTIKFEDIEALFAKTENTPPDLTDEIRPGDFVKLSCNAENYRDFHVDGLSQHGYLYGRYGTRESSEWMWLRLLGAPVPADAVVEVWRKVDVVKRDSFVFEDKTCPVTSLESEWRQVR